MKSYFGPSIIQFNVFLACELFLALTANKMLHMKMLAANSNGFASFNEALALATN